MFAFTFVIVGVSSPLLARGESDVASDFRVSCVRALTNPTGDKVNACSAIGQEFGVECVAHWGDPNSDMIRACGEVASRDAADCVNALRAGNFDLIRACASFDNPYAPRCVKEWNRPSPDIIRACGRVANPYALGCIDALTKGIPDTINACAYVKDQVGLDCVNNSQDKTSDRIHLCSIVDSLPDTNINCVHCSAEQKAQNIKSFNKYLDTMNEDYGQMQTKLQKALKDNGFLHVDQDNIMALMNCNIESLKAIEFILTYKHNGNAVQVDLPKAPTCVRIFENYDAYLSTRER